MNEIETLFDEMLLTEFSDVYIYDQYLNYSADDDAATRLMFAVLAFHRRILEQEDEISELRRTMADLLEKVREK